MIKDVFMRFREAGSKRSLFAVYFESLKWLPGIVNWYECLAIDAPMVTEQINPCKIRVTGVEMDCGRTQFR